MKVFITITIACIVFASYAQSAQNNCPGADGTAGVNCTSPSLCCGSGTMNPSCLPPDGSKKCCIWYLDSIQCNPNQVCGGSYGYGASSEAQCGPPNSTFCNKGDADNAFCTAAQPTCCGYESSYAFCCAPGCACNNSYYTCSCPTTAAPTTLPPTTAAPTTAVPTTAAAPKNNCPAAGGQPGVNCSDPSLCCGYGTMDPTCLPADGSKKCCVWYLDSIQCNPDQVCGGSYGYGASSEAQCGPPNSTFCNKGDADNAFCTAAQPTCCGYESSYAFCCAPGCACNNSYYTCSCPTTAAPTTIAPTTATPTTAAPPKNNCPAAGGQPGVNCSDPSLCCGYGTMDPTCLPADGSKKCCVWYLDSIQCNPNQVCGGSYGYGASSYAQCGPPNSTFCNQGDGSNAFCTAAQPTCCGNYGSYAFCCAPGCACNNSANTCSCPTTAAPTTKRPTTAAPTTAAPTTAQPTKFCPAPQGGGKFTRCNIDQKCCGQNGGNATCCASYQRCSKKGVCVFNG